MAYNRDETRDIISILIFMTHVIYVIGVVGGAVSGLQYALSNLNREGFSPSTQDVFLVILVGMALGVLVGGITSICVTIGMRWMAQMLVIGDELVSQRASGQPPAVAQRAEM